MTQSHRRCFRPIWSVIGLLVLPMGISVSAWAGSAEDDAQSCEGKGCSKLRGLFLDTSLQSAETARTVGRVAVRLNRNGNTERVPINHPFKAGDQIQFELASNLDGWLRIINITPAGVRKTIWPPSNDPTDETSACFVEGGSTVVIPEAPAAFVFDQEVGDETFVIALLSDRGVNEKNAAGEVVEKRPKLAEDKPDPEPRKGRKAPAPPRAKAAPVSKSGKIRQIKLRGTDVSQWAERGVRLIPSPDAVDPFLYFADSKQEGEVAAVTFRLNHE